MVERAQNNAAEIIITIVAIIILISSCGSTHSLCPSYGKGVTEAEVGDMYASQEWDRD